MLQLLLVRLIATAVLAGALLLSGCGSGGGTSLQGAEGDLSCDGSGCVRDDEEPAAPSPKPDSTPRPECSADSECVAIERCFTCADGVELCPEGQCVEGQCLFAVPDCAEPPPPDCGGFGGAGCPPGYACVDDPSDDCEAGPAADCPGICEVDAGEECSDDGDCPPLRAPCSECPDGSSSCPRSYCERGRCQVEMRACPHPDFCGGFAGFPCPPGLVCVDDPGDECDPQQGGADCIGMCVPEVHDGRCGGFAGSTCLPHEECIDDPSDECDPAAGGADCPGRCQPRIEPICSTDGDCPQIRIPCSVCPDGSEVCADIACVEGVCHISFPACPPAASCNDDDTCPSGQVCGDDPADRCDSMVDASCARICISEEAGPRRCGGFAGQTCPPGYHCVDDPSDECDPEQGGADCGGVCSVDETRECRSEADCPHILAPCTLCPDGGYACPRAFCEDGSCGAAIESCPDPAFCGGIAGFPCPPDHECIDDPGDDCDPRRGGADCGGICVPREQAPPQCAGDNDCAQIEAPCRECPDGTFACPRSACIDGGCRLELEACAAAQ